MEGMNDFFFLLPKRTISWTLHVICRLFSPYKGHSTKHRAKYEQIWQKFNVFIDTILELYIGIDRSDISKKRRKVWNSSIWK